MSLSTIVFEIEDGAKYAPPRSNKVRIWARSLRVKSHRKLTSKLPRSHIQLKFLFSLKAFLWPAWTWKSVCLFVILSETWTRPLVVGESDFRRFSGQFIKEISGLRGNVRKDYLRLFKSTIDLEVALNLRLLCQTRRVIFCIIVFLVINKRNHTKSVPLKMHPFGIATIGGYFSSPWRGSNPVGPYPYGVLTHLSSSNLCLT